MEHKGRVVITLADHRASAKSDHFACSCGCVWFDTKVVIEGQQVTGWTAPLRCTDCGTEVTP